MSAYDPTATLQYGIAARRRAYTAPAKVEGRALHPRYPTALAFFNSDRDVLRLLGWHRERKGWSSSVIQKTGLPFGEIIARL